MRRIGSQDYAVTRQDFPIRIEMEGSDLAVLQCEPSQVVVTAPGGTPIATVELQFSPVPGAPMQSQASLSDQAVPSEITFTLVLGYDTPSGNDPRYEVRLSAASGDADTRKVKPPKRRLTTHFEYR